MRLEEIDVPSNCRKVVHSRLVCYRDDSRRLQNQENHAESHYVATHKNMDCVSCFDSSDTHDCSFSPGVP